MSSLRPSLQNLPIRALYSIGELARASGIERRTLKRLLVAARVELMSTGRVSFVPLCELEVKVRPLWEAIKAAHALRGLIDEM
jgi:hypothetical protein